MDRAELLMEISKKDFDRNYFVDFINRDKDIRDIIICEMVSNSDIMVYYHCYYVVSDASWEMPSLYYKYWDEFASLLDHDNSYHRDIGLTIIANLVQVDYEDRLSLIWPKYIEHVYDKKFMTGKCCLHNLRKILRIRVDLRDKVVPKLLNLYNECPYKDKQIALMACNILDIFDDLYLKSSKKERITAFIERGVNSISPKTRKRAKQLIKKYNL